VEAWINVFGKFLPPPPLAREARINAFSKSKRPSFVVHLRNA
jgi:hypothetical protein